MVYQFASLNFESLSAPKLRHNMKHGTGMQNKVLKELISSFYKPRTRFEKHLGIIDNLKVKVAVKVIGAAEIFFSPFLFLTTIAFLCSYVLVIN